MNPTSPSLKTYRAPYLDRIILPLGGIGTGTVGFAGNGALRDWEIMNVPAKGYVPSFGGQRRMPTPSLLLRCQQPESDPWIKVMEGPLPFSAYEGPEGSPAPNAGLPRFRRAEFSTAYPFGEVRLQDPTCPLEVSLQAFNPLIPHDSVNSSWPVAFFRIRLSNPSPVVANVSAVFSLPNFIGADGGDHQLNAFFRSWDPSGFSRNVNTLVNRDGIAGVLLSSEGVDPNHRAWGTMALSCRPTGPWSHRTSWAGLDWGNMLHEFWDDLLSDGQLEERTASHATPMASLCQSATLEPGQSTELEFCLSWYFPNRDGWFYIGGLGDSRIGNRYTTRHADAWETACDFWPQQTELETKTRTFVDSVIACDAPTEFKEAALFNLSTLRSQTCFQAADGRFFAWEGVFDRKGACYGSCNHVWNYEQAIGSLFPDLAMSMHRSAFIDGMDERGLMPFRLVLSNEPEKNSMTAAAADGQTGHIIRVFREWIGSGDETFFQELWPRVRRALEFCWIPGGWDADGDGVMEGCQHNTLDVEYFGPNPLMTGWYLAALQAGATMARHAGDPAFAEKCESLWQRGRDWVRDHLFNGDYFEQQVQLPANPDAIAPGLFHYRSPEAGKEPPFQIGSGCLIDQLVGDCMARLTGIPPSFNKKQTRKTLRSILKYNRRTDFWEHFNPLRNYCVGDEKGILMLSYPRGNRPIEPLPYVNEVMTGFEYSVALHLLLIGEEKLAVRTVRDIRERYDGRKRSPFDEAECGHHYGRALASWGLLSAWSGLFYNALEKTAYVGRAGKHLITCPAGWGILEVTSTTPLEWKLQALGGNLKIHRVVLNPVK